MKNLKTILIQDESGMDTFSIRKLVSILLILSLQFGAMATGAHCSATTKAGTVCKAWAQKGSDKCYIHNPANKCEGINKAGAKCGGLKQKGSKYCSNHQNQVK